MLENLAADFGGVIDGMKANMMFSLMVIAILWGIQIINKIFHYGLNNFGIRTRSLIGLPGIIISPLLHGSFNHLFFNTIPLFVLSDLIVMEGQSVFFAVTIAVALLSGACTWLCGQRGIHVGASGVIMGYFGFLLAKAYFNFTASSIILAAVCLYYFGGLFFSLFPGVKKNMSWDGHIFGFLSGIFVAYYLPNILRIMRWF